jgi:hypothetical protein
MPILANEERNALAERFRSTEAQLEMERALAEEANQIGRLVDAFGLRRGSDVQQSDVVQAYLQAEIRGKATWVLLPQDQWPTRWAGVRKPVVRLRVALCGHPDSGTDW